MALLIKKKECNKLYSLNSNTKISNEKSLQKNKK